VSEIGLHKKYPISCSAYRSTLGVARFSPLTVDMRTTSALSLISRTTRLLVSQSCRSIRRGVQSSLMSPFSSSYLPSNTAHVRFTSLTLRQSLELLSINPSTSQHLLIPTTKTSAALESPYTIPSVYIPASHGMDAIHGPTLSNTVRLIASPTNQICLNRLSLLH
jgi:hypothetical protein